MEGFSYDNIHRLPLDVTKDDDVHKVVQTIVDSEGGIDILVNNAGTSTSCESVLKAP